MAEYTAWGYVQSTFPIFHGLREVSTAGHGGILVSEKLFKSMPEYAREYSYYGKDGKIGAFEEDCNWSIPFIIFADKIREAMRDKPEVHQKRLEGALQAAKDTAKAWCPKFYENFYGVTLKYGESYIKDEEIENEITKDMMQSVACWGDWHENVPKGYVGVCAKVGGRGKLGRGEESYYLIEASVYDEMRKNYRHVIVINNDGLTKTNSNFLPI